MTSFKLTAESFGMLCTGVVMSLLVLAGLSKFAAIDDFARSLKEWTLLPAWSRPIVLMVVPTSELAIGLAWLLGVLRRSMTACAIGMLVAFTIAYAVQRQFADPPSCGCFGLLERFRVVREASAAVLQRNLVLVGLLVIGTVIMRLDKRRRQVYQAAES